MCRGGDIQVKMGGLNTEDCWGRCKDAWTLFLWPLRGVWGHAPQEKFKFGFSEIASGPI